VLVTNNKKRMSILPPTGDYIFVLEDLELAFPKDQLNDITKRYNNGESVESIAETEKRDPDEIFLALFHQARQKKTKKPFAYRKG